MNVLPLSSSQVIRASISGTHPASRRYRRYVLSLKPRLDRFRDLCAVVILLGQGRVGFKVGGV